MSYLVKEAFTTLQGEGANAGRAAVFCRFTGCNLWSGREEHRAGAVCSFCDTDFVGTDGPGGGRFGDAAALADHLAALWSDAVAPDVGSGADPGGSPGGSPGGGPGVGPGVGPFVVCTGGEPLLQLDDALLEALHEREATVAIETNGTIEVPAGVDWVCVSPKAGAALVVHSGDELKLVHPQPGAEPERFEAMADAGELAFDHWFLQPMDGPEREANTAAAVAWCRAHPRWRLSVQTHKYLGIP